MTASATPLSIFVASPIEKGGVVARQGFAFQDHVAAGFCIDMLLVSELKQVWCETQDDCTLIWDKQGHVHVEYVQSKSTNPDQLWSVSLLCQGDSKSAGQSILEKSLAYDRCIEACDFRIVTTTGVNSALRPLTYRLGAPGRDAALPEVIDLHNAVKSKVGGFRSKNGNDCAFWLDRATWDVRHGDDAVKDRNTIKLTRALQRMDIFLAADQVDELYTKILKKVWDASLIDAADDPAGKRINAVDFHRWIIVTVNEINLPVTGSEKIVQGKLERASLAEDVVRLALEQRRYYREEVLSEKYLPLDHRKLIEREISAVLQRLKSRLDKGELPDDGISFHDRCLAELDNLRDSLPITPRPPLSILHGCMYSMTGRCVHRFRRATA